MLKLAKSTMFTSIGISLIFLCIMFTLSNSIPHHFVGIIGAASLFFGVLCVKLGIYEFIKMLKDDQGK